MHAQRYYMNRPAVFIVSGVNYKLVIRTYYQVKLGNMVTVKKFGNMLGTITEGAIANDKSIAMQH